MVEPEDVRWIFLSHDDGDHTGGLFDVLERCPGRRSSPTSSPSNACSSRSRRCRFRACAGSSPAVASTPATACWGCSIRGSSTARPRAGLFDPKSGALWIVDSFACFTPGSLDADDLPQELLAQVMPALSSAISPGHAWLDPGAYVRHVDTAGARYCAGGRLDDAFDRLRALAGSPLILTPRQELLDSLLEPTLAEAAEPWRPLANPQPPRRCPAVAMRDRAEVECRPPTARDCHTAWKLGNEGPEPDTTRLHSGHPSNRRCRLRPAAGLAAAAGMQTLSNGGLDVSSASDLAFAAGDRRPDRRRRRRAAPESNRVQPGAFRVRETTGRWPTSRCC